MINGLPNKTLSNLTVTSLGGCIVHDVVKSLKTSNIEVLNHYWRRPTIALMSEPVTRSRFKLHELPAPFVNYFVNDVSKLHRSEIEALPNKDVIVFDITRDLFTGVLEVDENSYMMNVLEAVGIVDGISEETMSPDKIQDIIGKDLKKIGYQVEGDEFFELWKDHFLQFLEFLRSNFNQLILLKLFFTDRLVGGHVYEPLVETAERGNKMLARMYAFAEEQGVDMIGLEQEAYVTGHFVEWGGPSLTHYVQETTARLSDAVLAALMPNANHELSFNRQAYRRAGNYEQTMLWLNEEKAKLAKIQKSLESERKQREAAQSVLLDQVSDLLRQAETIDRRVREVFGDAVSA